MAKRKGMDVVIQERPKGTISYGYFRISGCNIELQCPVCGVKIPANTDHECEFGKKNSKCTGWSESR